MSTPHKNADILRAIADGATFDYRQVRADTVGPWTTLTKLWPLDESYHEFRAQPHRWQREIDAEKAKRAVQARFTKDGSWMDSSLAWNFDCKVTEFRIKPEVLRYRVAQMGIGGTQSADTKGQEAWLASRPGFVGWLTDWQEVEVPA